MVAGRLRKADSDGETANANLRGDLLYMCRIYVSDYRQRHTALRFENS